MSKEKIKNKYKATTNLGLKVNFASKDPRPFGDWVLASDVEQLLSTALPVFSSIDMETKLFTTWERSPVQDPDVLGFIIGPYDIPKHGREALAETKPVEPEVSSIIDPNTNAPVNEEGPKLIL